MYINCIMWCTSHELQIYNVDTDIEMDNNSTIAVHSTAHYFSKSDKLPVGMGQCFLTWNSLEHNKFAASLLHYYQYKT
jgi:hypothetical protein